jgi:hypothetical protein
MYLLVSIYIYIYICTFVLNINFAYHPECKFFEGIELITSVDAPTKRYETIGPIP